MMEANNVLLSKLNTDPRNVKDTMGWVFILLIIAVTLNALQLTMNELHAT
jgi:hypothetical protein